MSRSRTWLLALLSTLIMVVPALGPRSLGAARQEEDKVGAGDDALVRKVRKSIDDGVAFLRSQQIKHSGSWELGPNTSPGGTTALVLLALLNAGVKPNDPVIVGGLKYSRSVQANQHYAISLQTMVYCLVKDPIDKKAIQDNVRTLLAARKAQGWNYPHNTSPTPDNSNTQYVLLALHEANRAGYKVDAEALKAIQTYFLKSQVRGGWGYKPNDTATTFTMTTAGLCNLLITGMDLATSKAALRADGSAERCGIYEDNRAVLDALEWVSDAFPARITQANAVSRLKHPFYALYGIERAGRLSGQRYFGGHDWYEVGCRYLADTQRPDGDWTSEGTLDRWPVVATSFSLLFLSRGRTPVLVSKLAYGSRDSTGWNNKRSDMKNLVEFTSRELFKGEPLAWQAFDVRQIPAGNRENLQQLAAALLQSPVVYFNGHDLAPRGKEADILKEYVANGGFLFVENCCGKARHPAFDRDFRRLMGELFPESKLEPLEKEHPVWLASGKFAVSPGDFPLEGIKLGCKTVVIYSPVPLAGYWEADLHGDRAKGEKAFQLGASVLAYATGLEAPRPRLSRVEITQEKLKDKKPPRGYIQVAQLRHEGDWQPAPRAMRSLMIESRKLGLDVVLKTQPVYPSDDAVLDYKFLYMQGRNKFTVTKEDLKHLHFNLTSGGLLLADSCCGSAAFTASFRTFVSELFAAEKLTLEKIPYKDELYSLALSGSALRAVRRREQSADGRRVEPDFKTAAPELEGVKYKGRWVVIFSKYDLGCALELAGLSRATAPNCLGHDADSAVRLSRAALLYALKR